MDAMTAIPVRRLLSRPQRTIRRSVTVAGFGIVTGMAVRLRFEPAPADTGVIFVRDDLRSRPTIPAHCTNVTGTQRRTTIGNDPAQVTLVEHVLAALSGLRIDNCRVNLDGPEPPGLDGSARGFVEALHEAEIVTQSARRDRWTVTHSIVLRQGGSTLAIHPTTGKHLKISYLLDYGPNALIPPQIHTSTITPEVFQNSLAPSRTFLLESEAAELQERGIGRHLKHSELLVFGEHGVIDNQLRFGDEPSRHKVLDLVGDLALSGVDLVGHVVAYRSGHPLNIELARTLTQLFAQASLTPRTLLAA